LELLEKQTLRTIVQALQQYSSEAKEIFDNTKATSETEVIVLAEDLVQYALEVAECYPINKRFAGFVDYKRVRWLTTPFGIFPQVLLVDAKASTENNRDTLQQSQLPMDAEFVSNNRPVTLKAGILPHLPIVGHGDSPLVAVTTSAFIHFYYKEAGTDGPPYRNLLAIYVLMIPHGSLKTRYNPDPNTTFFGQGKHSPKRGEVPRIRVYFGRLRAFCPWRLQELHFAEGQKYTLPVWRDVVDDHETSTPFGFIGR
jgi:Type II restriction enzyme SfiI